MKSEIVDSLNDDLKLNTDANNNNKKEEEEEEVEEEEEKEKNILSITREEQFHIFLLLNPMCQILPSPTFYR